MSDELSWDDLRNALNNANHHASVLGLDDISEKIQDLQEEYEKERKKRIRNW